jgi:NADH-quinone oxidoreductase subunit J
MTFFYLFGAVAVIASLLVIAQRNPIYSVLLLIASFGALSGLYVLLDAPFVAVTQIIVYAGAIMVLFLFVVMLVGVDYSESLTETLRGQRVTAILLGVGFGALLLLPIARAVTNTTAKGLGESGFNDNVGAIARILFTKYVFAFEVVSALLIVAAIGAMVLGHRDLRGTRLSQREQSIRRFSDPDKQASPLPGPGVYALHDAVDRPALLPDGSAARTSVTTEYAGGIDEAYEEVVAERADRPSIDGSRARGAAGGRTESGVRTGAVPGSAADGDDR